MCIIASIRHCARLIILYDDDDDDDAQLETRPQRECRSKM